MNELTKVLSVKEQAQEQLLVVIKALGIGKIVRNLKFEKAQGYSLTLKQRKEQFNKVAATGMSDAQLYKQAGNAVTTNVIEALARFILEIDKENANE